MKQSVIKTFSFPVVHLQIYFAKIDFAFRNMPKYPLQYSTLRRPYFN